MGVPKYKGDERMDQQLIEVDDYNLTVEIARLLGERGHRKAIIFLLNIVRKLALDNKIDLNVIRRLL